MSRSEDENALRWSRKNRIEWPMMKRLAESESPQNDSESPQDESESPRESEIPLPAFPSPSYTLRLNRDSAAILLKLLHSELDYMRTWKMFPAQAAVEFPEWHLLLYEVSALIELVESCLTLTDEIMELPQDDVT